MYEQQQQQQYQRFGKVYFNPNQNMPITVLMNMEQLQQLMQLMSQIPTRSDGKPPNVKLMAKLFPQQNGTFDGTLTYLPPNQPPAAPAQPVYQMAYQPQGQFQQQYPQPPVQQYQPQQPPAQPQYTPQPQYAPQPQYVPQPQQPPTDWGQFQQQVAPQGALPIPQVGESPWA